MLIQEASNHLPAAQCCASRWVYDNIEDSVFQLIMQIMTTVAVFSVAVSP